MADQFLTLLDNIAAAKTERPVRGEYVTDALSGKRPARLKIERDGATGTVAVYRAGRPNPYAPKKEADTDAQVFVGDASTRQFTSVMDYVAWSNWNWLVEVGEDGGGVIVMQGATAGFAIANDGGKARIDFATESDTGDGSTTAFTLVMDYDHWNDELSQYFDLVVTVDGTEQTEDTDYTLDDNSGALRVTFTTAPANTLAIVYNFIPKSDVRIKLFNLTVETVLADGANQHVDKEIVTDDYVWGVTTGGTVSNTRAIVEPGATRR